MAAPNVPFVNPLLRGEEHAGVTAAKRAVSRAMPDVYQWTAFTDYFGEHFEEAVKTFQRRRAIQPTGKIGLPTWNALEKTRRDGHPSEWAFDTRAIQLATAYYKAATISPDERARRAIVAAAAHWYSQRSSIAYSQARPFQRGFPPWSPSRWDCSGFVTCCYEAGRAPDPNGRGYDGQGYTGTLMNTGHGVDLSDLKPADLVFYGWTRYSSPAFPIGSPTHVAIYAGGGMVYSMGSYPMGWYRVAYRSINHARTYRVV